MKATIRKKLGDKLSKVKERLSDRESARQESLKLRREGYEWLQIHAPWKLNPSK